MAASSLASYETTISSSLSARAFEEGNTFIPSKGSHHHHHHPSKEDMLSDAD